MCCPYCKKEIKLTWKSYIKGNLTFKYKCPACCKNFKTKFYFFYQLELGVIQILLSLLVALVTICNEFSITEIITYSLLLPLPLLLVFDKANEQKMETKKIESEDDQG